eukprot:UN12702
MTKCAGGELFSKVKSGARYNESETKYFVYCLLKALKHIHDQNIVHRDLKLENCLLDDIGRLSNLRLIDYGSAIQYDPNKTNECFQDLAGTPYYMSPEAVRNMERSGSELKATDIP